MTNNQLMIERAKEIISKDCIDIIGVTAKRIKRYLHDSRRSKEFDYIFGIAGTTVNTDETINLALNELVKEGKIVKVKTTFRKKYKHEV